MIQFTNEQREQIINFGAFGYSENRISSILELDIDEVTKDFSDKNSELSKLLQKGKVMADYVIDLKLFELAKSGDIKALSKLQTRKSLRK